MRKQIETLLGISAILAFLATVLMLLFPGALILLILGPGPGLVALAILFVVSFIVIFIVIAAIGWIAMKIPRSWLIIGGVLILLVGIILFQPEIDIVGLAAIIFGFLQTSTGRRMLKG